MDEVKVCPHCGNKEISNYKKYFYQDKHVLVVICKCGAIVRIREEKREPSI